MAELQNAGITLVEIEIPNLNKLLEAANFPVAIYETGEDLPYYLKHQKSELTLQQLDSDHWNQEPSFLIAW